MKIAYGSDFHLEHRINDKGEYLPDLPDIPDCDLVIVAGDAGIAGQGLQWLEQNLNGKQAIFIPGNHEYYYYSNDSVNDYFKNYENDNIVILNPGVIEMQDTVFIGANLRSALELPGYKDLHSSVWARSIGDFQVVEGWTPEKHVDQHLEEVGYIQEQLEKYRDKKRIVVTHYVPTTQCIAPFFADSPLNPYFINDLDWLIDNHRPEAWIFGHTHTKFNKLHSNEYTQLRCNPRGYPQESKRKYTWEVFDI